VTGRLQHIAELAGTGADPTDIALLTAGLAAGDEAAFRQFHALYFDRLLRYLLVVSRGDDEAARDALQEALRRVVRHARRFEDETVFWSWLTVLARSAASDGARRRHRYWRLLTHYARWRWMPVQPDPRADADTRLHELLGAALDKLEPLERLLLEGKYFRRESVRELADATGLTEKAVESRLVRARRTLKDHLHHALRHET
jgi:RNA polymerase sigma-70 factor (ECF subfamily)